MKENEKTIYINGNGVVVDEKAEIEIGDYIVDVNKVYRIPDEKAMFLAKELGKDKIIATIAPYKIEGVPMIGESETLTDVPMVEEEINSKHNPRNREQAFAYQFEDDVKKLISLSLLNKEAFIKHLVVLKTHILSYEEYN